MANHRNFAQTTLAAAITDTSGTSITVTSETSFPSVPFIISIDTECMLVTNVSTTTWTVTRGYEGSTAATHTNGTAIFHDISAAEADAIAGKLDKAGGTMTGNLIMDNMDITLVKLLTLHGEIDDGNSSTADTIDWNLGAAHKSTLTGNVTFAFTGADYAVPDMTSETAPSGVASDSSTDSNGWRPFQRSNGDYYAAYQPPVWWRYDFGAGNGAIATQYNVYWVNDNDYYATAWQVQGSQNGTDWTDLDVVTGNTTKGSLQNFTIDTPAFYRYYQLLCTAKSKTAIICCRFEPLVGVSNPVAPCFLTLKLVQDGTGGRTVTWPATVKGSPVINQAANSISNVLFYWDGTSYYTLNGLPWVAAPAAANSAGFAGQMAWDTSYIYVCTAASTWKRVAIATW